MSELCCGAPTFGVVAGVAGQRQVAHPIGATTSSRHNVLDLQWYSLGATARAPAPPLLQQILSNRVPSKGPLLVRDSRDLWILEGLGIELHQPLGGRPHRCEAAQLADPSQHILDPTLKRRW